MPSDRECAAFAYRFNEALRDKGLRDLSLSDLNRLTGYSRTALSNWRNGIAMPSRESAIYLSEVLEVSLVWLYFNSGGMNDL